MIELLVSIAIIGILTALLLPAVQMTREAARRKQCVNNLRQFVLAAHNFEQSHGRLPPGIDFQHVGPIVYLLPYLDQSKYYDEFSFDNRFVYWYQNPLNRPPLQGAPFLSFPIPRPPARYAAEGTLPVLLCPSAPPASAVGGVLMTVTHGVPGVDFTAGIPTDWYLYCGAPGSEILTRNYYAAVAGDYFYGNGKYRGAFWYSAEGKGIRLTDIKDGTSNTLFFGETAGDNVLWDPSVGPQLNSLCVATSGLYVTDGIDNDADYLQPDWQASHFGSRHPGIIHFAYADGSVRGLRKGGSWNEGPLFQLLLRLGGINDGEVVSGVD